jgi:Leucine-rich repeat (LRR) protein
MDGVAALHTVPSELCTIYSLEELVLTNLELTSVSAQCFSNMSNLVRWSMQSNSLVTLPNDLLVGQTKLAEFNVAHNDIADVQPELFQNTASVSTLINIDFTF